MQNLLQIENILTFCKMYLISFFTCYMSLRIMNKMQVNKLSIVNLFISALITSIIYTCIKDKVDQLYSVMTLIILLSFIILKITQKIISFIITTISFAANNILFFVATIICVFIKSLLKIDNKNVVFVWIIFTYILLVFLVSRMRRFKNGFSFLDKNMDNEYFGMLLFNVSLIILFLIIFVSDYSEVKTGNIGVIMIFFPIIMFITIQKSLQLYYKQKLLAQELENTKKELEEKTKEIENLEAENIAISKKAHTLDHKQKSLAKKIDEMMLNTEISKEEVAEVKERLNKIGQDLYKEKTAVELSKTEIPEIDDMLTTCNQNVVQIE